MRRAYRTRSRPRPCCERLEDRTALSFSWSGLVDSLFPFFSDDSKSTKPPTPAQIEARQARLASSAANAASLPPLGRPQVAGVMSRPQNPRLQTLLQARAHRLAQVQVYALEGPTASD